MKIDLTIGKLTLGGVARNQRHQVAAAVMGELERLVRGGGIPASWQAAAEPASKGRSGSRPSSATGLVDGGELRQRSDAAPRLLGAGIGRAVYATNPTPRG